MTRRGVWLAVLGVVVLAAVVLAAVLAGGGSGRDEDAATGRTPPPSSSPASSSPATSSPATSSPASSSPAVTPAPATPSDTGGTGVPAALRGQDLTAVPTDRRVVALTFDAGGDSAGLAAILGTLAERRVPATFFVTGRWAAGDPAGLRAVRDGGHRIGNHTTDHPHLPALSDAAIAEQLRGVERTVQAAGVDPRPLFRFPFGDRDARTIATVNDLGYVAVRWTVDTLGWQGTSGGRSVQSVTDRAVGALAPGAIVLMHVGAHPEDRSTLDADALPGVIDRMRAAGYSFVTLDALTGH